MAGGSPPDIGRGVAVSPDGTVLAVVHSSTPFLTRYRLSDEAKLANPSGGLPPNTSRSVAWG
ncbi:hypothetical protein D9M68_899290 [compost metagenome]